MAGVNFTRAAAERIIAATKRVERTPTNLVGDRNARQEAGPPFWAYLTSGGGSGGFWFSWIKVQPVKELPSSMDPWTEEEPPLFEMAEPHVTGYQNAREASNNRNVPPGCVVQLDLLGYGRDGEPQYVFTYAAPVVQGADIPLHDHRDNVTGGGFAFATYHPGTSLPQQPWHL